MRRILLVMLGVVLVSSTAWAYRSKHPQAFADLSDPNQMVELNNFLSDVWNLTNGRYTLENLTTNPQDTRKGVKGDLVYATFGGNDHLCVSTSFPEGKDWTCVNVGTLSTCPGGADTQVQFNDNGDCGGDIGFLFDKNLDHASLGPDAKIDKSMTPNNYNDYYGGSFPKLLVLSDDRSSWVAGTTLDGIAVEFKASPSGTRGFDTGVVLEGISSRFVASGTAGSTVDDNEIVSNLTGTHYSALTNIVGTGSVDEIDTMVGDSFNHELLINLSGTGTNDISGGIVWDAVSDTTQIIADTLTDLTVKAHNQNLTVTVPTITGTVTNSGFIADTTVTATTSVDNVIHQGVWSDVTITTPDPGDIAVDHFQARSTYTASATV